MAATEDAGWGPTMKSDDFLDDDLQGARERAARAKERHRQEEEQRQRRALSRRKPAEGAEPEEDSVELPLPGLERSDLPDADEDWGSWGLPPQPAPAVAEPASEAAPPEAADAPEKEPSADARRDEAAVNRELHQRYDEKQAQLRRLRDEIDRVERERRHLEALKRRQEDYEAGKGQVMDQLRRGQAEMARELVQTEELAECLKTTRGRFEALLTELEAIREEEWPNEALEDELAKAADQVARAREEVTRAQARLKVLRPERALAAVPADEKPGEAPVREEAPAALANSGASSGGGAVLAEESYGRLVRRALAYSLPGMATAVVLFILWLIFQYLRVPYY